MLGSNSFGRKPVSQKPSPLMGGAPTKVGTSAFGRGGRGMSRGYSGRLRSGIPRSLNYRSGSYGAPYKAPTTRTRGGGTKPSGRWVNAATGRPGGRGPRVFQPGVYVNAGRDRGSAFVRYIAPKPVTRTVTRSTTPFRSAPKPAPKPAPRTPAPSKPTDPRYPPGAPAKPRPPADTISPGPRPEPPLGDGGGRELRIRESPARRTAFGRSRRASGSRRSLRVNRTSVGGLNRQNNPRVGLNI